MKEGTFTKKNKKQKITTTIRITLKEWVNRDHIKTSQHIFQKRNLRKTNTS